MLQAAASTPGHRFGAQPAAQSGLPFGRSALPLLTRRLPPHPYRSIGIGGAAKGQEGGAAVAQRRRNEQNRTPWRLRCKNLRWINSLIPQHAPLPMAYDEHIHRLGDYGCLNKPC